MFDYGQTPAVARRTVACSGTDSKSGESAGTFTRTSAGRCVDGGNGRRRDRHGKRRRPSKLPVLRRRNPQPRRPGPVDCYIHRLDRLERVDPDLQAPGAWWVASRARPQPPGFEGSGGYRAGSPVPDIRLGRTARIIGSAPSPERRSRSDGCRTSRLETPLAPRLGLAGGVTGHRLQDSGSELSP
jgi:hypothetical protein